jgi:hypothetical protein
MWTELLPYILIIGFAGYVFLSGNARNLLFSERKTPAIENFAGYMDLGETDQVLAHHDKLYQCL